MKRFSFSLQRVLDLRRARRDERAREAARLLRETLKEKERLFRYQSQWEELCAENIHDLPAHPVNHFYYRETVIKRIQAQMQLVREKEKSLALARTQLLIADRECQALELLRDKQKRAYLQWVSQQEQNFLDEAGTVGFVRSRETG